MPRRILLLLTVLLSLPALAGYEQPGPYATRKCARGSVTVGGSSSAYDLYVPDAAGRWPIVAVGHGFSANASNMAGWGTLLASRGNVVVVPDFGGSNHARNAEVLLAALDKVAGAGGVPAACGFLGTVDGTRQGLAGHSAGGLSAFLAAAQRPSVRAVVLLDAVDKDDLGLSRAAQVRSPVLFLFAESSSCNASNNSTAWYTGVPGTKGRLKVVGAKHCAPQEPASGQCFFCGGSDSSRTPTFKRYGAGWLQYFVSCDAAARASVDGADLTADKASGRVTADAFAGMPVTTPSCAGGGGGGGTDGGVPGTDGGTPPPTDGGTPDAGPPDGGGGGGGGGGGCGLAPEELWMVLGLMAVLAAGGGRRGA